MNLFAVATINVSVVVKIWNINLSLPNLFSNVTEVVSRYKFVRYENKISERKIF